jgi:hypothetical protein
MLPMSQQRKRIKRIRYKGFHFQDCVYCGCPLVWLIDPKDPDRRVPVVRGSWMVPPENRTRYWLRRIHRYHFCYARLEARARIRLYESRAARPAWAQGPEFDPL